MSASQAYIEEAKSFESILVLQKDLLANRAWIVSYVLLGLCIILSIIIFLLFWLQEKELVLIRVDNRTGAAELISSVTKSEISEDEAIGKYFASLYLTLREQYIYGSLQQDYQLVQIYSMPSVKKEYIALFDKEDAADRVLGEDFAVKIEIISISIGEATDPYKLASIRYKKKTTDLRNQKTKEEFLAAKIVYDFMLEEQVSSKIRLTNPLGFKVVNYQVTPELH